MAYVSGAMIDWVGIWLQFRVIPKMMKMVLATTCSTLNTKRVNVDGMS